MSEENDAFSKDFQNSSFIYLEKIYRDRNQKQPVMCQWHLNVKKVGVKFMTAFKVIVVKTKFIIVKYD